MTSTATGIKTEINATNIEIQFLSPSIVRVLKYPKDVVLDKKSLAVIKTPEKLDLNTTEDADSYTVSSSKLRVKLDRKTATVSFLDSNEKSFFTEKKQAFEFLPTNDAGESTFKVSQSFQLEPDEAIYGLGILQNRKMSQRNQKIHMVQNNTEDFVPFFQSIKGYGLYWDNYSPTNFDDNASGTSFQSAVGNCIDYYFMLGGNADGVIAQMRDL
ncbi:MAG TPA: DUF4968 domain-containing protein, partial [Flavobacterium sp.]|nr:DUF4968 domain-containing protein [Flavobacterium sp.]